MAKLFVKAHPKSKKKRILEKDGTHFEIWVSETPDKGKANEAVIQALSLYLRVPKSRLSIVSGHASRNKVLQLDHHA